MEWLVDIIKVVIPMSLMVLLAYVLMSQFFDGQLKIKSMELRRVKSNDSLEVRLNAYERLALYLERISIPDIIIRVNNEQMEAYTLYSALLLTIQRELEHNMAQQIYVSENLWNIVKLAKQDLANLITDAFSEDPNQTVDQYINALLKRYSERDPNPIEKAKSAIRQEASLLL